MSGDGRAVDAPTGAEPVPVLSASMLSKTFSGKRVLRDVDLDIAPGEIHGLLGQNGSGKSTLIKVLAGYYTPDEGGSLSINGRVAPLPLTPRQSEALGLSFVHQDLGLAPQLTVLENLRVGHYETGPLWKVRWRRERSTVRAILREFGVEHIDPDALVLSLREIDRARVAIVRALHQIREHHTGVLVLDEPTVYLPRDGVELLFSTLRRVTEAGFGVLFVTHRLEEVHAVTDRVTILRDGARVDTGLTRDLSEGDLLERILGREVGQLYPAMPEVSGEQAMHLHVDSGDGISDFTLDLRRGEVVGLTGLLGMGHDRVPYLAFGAGGDADGELVVKGVHHQLRNHTPRRAITGGLALLPADRLQNGGAQEATILENVTLPTVFRYFGGGILHHRQERRSVRQMLEMYQVTPPEPGKVFAELSGGNQQKALVAKWFQVSPEVLLLHEPTQGVDVGARTQIFERIRDFAQGGGAVVIASVEYEDLAHLCDRVLVLRDGRTVSELRKPNLSEEIIVEHCFRVPGERIQA
ncbi:MAG: sugar ABC transporter ATP-binding protein [Acidimicrobiaceae bacterium]|nr:sugar ABC transporter ATP-binding protein [Acidimicrobiaceae bacterium]